MLDAFHPHAELFTADIELRRMLLAQERKRPPFLTLQVFGLMPLADSNPFEHPYASPSSPSNSETPK